ncbi:Amino acid permease [Musa troglodytarum]|uniref:Amino acid permease n=1 Tax=Musa troglodytarum TaxID=320322 RepID=A0A9E7KEX1_9LILI|nr:Amino acid permease [Musa troglodytarum]
MPSPRRLNEGSVLPRRYSARSSPRGRRQKGRRHWGSRDLNNGEEAEGVPASGGRDPRRNSEAEGGASAIFWWFQQI